MKLRMINSEDIRDVLRIYKPFVKNTPITFEYTVPSYKKFVKRVSKITGTYPWIVAELDGNIIGYAYTSRFRERAAFAWDAEVSVYIEDKYQGQGVGRALYQAVEDISRMQGIYNIYALITSTAKQSLDFHKALKYEYMYTLNNCGWKFDRWYSMACFVKTIGDFDKEPEPVIPIGYLDEGKIKKVLNKSAKLANI